MKYRTSGTKKPRQTDQVIRENASENQGAASLSPPDYGIDFVDSVQMKD